MAKAPSVRANAGLGAIRKPRGFVSNNLPFRAANGLSPYSTLQGIFGAGQPGMFFSAYNPDDLLVRRNFIYYSEDIAHGNPWPASPNYTATRSEFPSPIPGVYYEKLEVIATGFTNCSQVVTAVGKASGNNFSVYTKRGNLNDASFLLRNNTTGINISGGTFSYVTGIFNLATNPTGKADVKVTPIPNTPDEFLIELTIQGNDAVKDGDTLAVYVGYTGGTQNAGEYIYATGIQLTKSLSRGTYQKITDWNTEYLDAYLNLVGMWQEATGLSPDVVIDNPLGELLNGALGSYWPRGAELWDDATAVIAGESSRVAPNVYRIYSSAGADSNINTPALTTIPGETYELTFNVDSVTIAGGGLSTFGFVTNPTFTGTGPKRALLQATGSAVTPAKRVAGATDYQISNVSIRSVSSNVAAQPTTSARPKLHARVNVLTKSENFADAAWSKTRASIGASDGTGVKLVEDTSLATSHLITQAPFIGGIPAIGYARLKAAERTWAAINVGGSHAAYFDLVNGVKGNVSVGASAYVEPAYDKPGYFDCWVYVANPGGSVFQLFTAISNGNAGYDGDGASGIYVARAHGEICSTTIPSTYQYVNTASDYDTVGFPFYLDYDGTDDGLIVTQSAGFLGPDMDVYILSTRRTANAQVSASDDVTGANFIGVLEAGNVAVCSSGVGGTWTAWVDGVQIGGVASTTRDELNTAFPAGTTKLLEFHNLDLFAWPKFVRGAYTGFMLNSRDYAVLVCPAQTDEKRAIIREMLYQKAMM